MELSKIGFIFLSPYYLCFLYNHHWNIVEQHIFKRQNAIDGFKYKSVSCCHYVAKPWTFVFTTYVCEWRIANDKKVQAIHSPLYQCNKITDTLVVLCQLPFFCSYTRAVRHETMISWFRNSFILSEWKIIDCSLFRRTIYVFASRT